MATVAIRETASLRELVAAVNNLATLVNELKADYNATLAKLDADAGVTDIIFTFSKVAVGSYYLTTYRKVSSTQEAFTYYKDTGTGKPYALNVTPLCATELGSLGY